MNLIDAVKSGKPFRRQAWGRNEWSSPDSWSKAFLKHDILADDWEIQEPTVTITRSQFIAAAKATWEDDFDKTRESPQQFSVRLAHKLGLE